MGYYSIFCSVTVRYRYRDLEILFFPTHSNTCDGALEELDVPRFFLGSTYMEEKSKVGFELVDIAGIRVILDMTQVYYIQSF